MLRRLEHSFFALPVHFRRDSGVLIVRRMVVWAVCTLLLSGAAPAKSPEPPKGDTKGAAQTAAPDKRGTDDVPLAIKILPAPDAATKAAEEKKEREEKAATDNLLVKWTYALFFATAALAAVAAVQVGLFWWQLLLMRDSVKDAALAARAARETAQAAKASIELARENASRELRAYIFVDRTKVLGIPNLPDDRFGLDVTIIFRNFGKTPAYKVIHTAIAYFEDQTTHEQLRKSESILKKMDVGPNSPLIRKYLAFAQRSDFEAVTEGKQLLFFAGTIKYVDAFDDEQVFPYKMVWGGPESAVTENTLRPCEDEAT